MTHYTKITDKAIEYAKENGPKQVTIPAFHDGAMFGYALRDEQAGDIVESYNDGGLFYRDYSLKSTVFGISSLESFASLLQSLSLEPNQILIIKKQ